MGVNERVLISDEAGRQFYVRSIPNLNGSRTRLQLCSGATPAPPSVPAGPPLPTAPHRNSPENLCPRLCRRCRRSSRIRSEQPGGWLDLQSAAQRCGAPPSTSQPTDPSLFQALSLAALRPFSLCESMARFRALAASNAPPPLLRPRLTPLLVFPLCSSCELPLFCPALCAPPSLRPSDPPLSRTDTPWRSHDSVNPIVSPETVWGRCR